MTHRALWSLGIGGVGRADWVRLVCDAGLSPRMAGELLGFEEVPPSIEAAVRETSPVRLDAADATLEPAPTPSTLVPIWRVIGPERKPPEQVARSSRPEWLDKGSPLRRLGARSQELPKPAPLVPESRLGCVLRQRLRRKMPGVELDERRLVCEVARCRVLRELPRRARLGWSPRLELYWDQAPTVESCWHDQFRVLRWLERWRGKSGLDVIVVDRAGTIRSVKRREGTPTSPPDAHTTVLALSDLGAAGDSESRRTLWANIAARAARAGARRVALVLCPSNRWPSGLTQGWSAVEWERARPSGSRASPALDSVEQARRQSRVDQLLTLLSPATRIEPALLRAARLLLVQDGADLGTELDAWLDPRVGGRSREGMFLELEAMHQLRSEFLEQPEALRGEIESLIDRHHKALSPVLFAEELMACGSRRAIRRAARLLGAYARRLEPRGASGSTEERYLTRLEARQQRASWQSDQLAAVWALAHRKGDRSGFGRALPPGLDLDQILWALRAPPEPRWCRLWQRGRTVSLWPIADPTEPLPSEPGALLADVPMRYGFVQVEGVDATVAATDPDASPDSNVPDSSARPLAAIRARAVVLDADERASFELPGSERSSVRLRLETDLARVELSAEVRPTWTDAFERHRQGLSVQASVVHFDWHVTPEPARRRPRAQIPVAGISRIESLARVPWPSWAATLETDAHGLFATLELAPSVVMRLRWIPPGCFLMGSPENETGRSQDEGPQHWVTLTRGFWLAETPCTQAEWQAVMRENPSHFKGARRPVEQVSWEDCQRFCSRVRERFPGLDARLPSEAEWEYACRAGTASAFNDGSSCTEPEGMDSALAKLGWFDQNSGNKTHPVAELEPNAWGLYDMHGNVWEWCQDTWTNHYPAEEQTDPVATTGAGRVCRGGGWDDVARDCRSAYRYGGRPGARFSFLGLRLAAGQLGEPSQGAEPQDKASAGQRAGGPRPGGGKAKGSKGGRKR